MTVLAPAADPGSQLYLQLESLEQRRPVGILEHRHVQIHTTAQVLTVVGLTGDNLMLGFSVGEVTAAVPHTVVVAGDPRDPALAVQVQAALADALEPFVIAELNGGAPLQLLIEGSSTLSFLRACTFRARNPWLPGPYTSDATLQQRKTRAEDLHGLLRAIELANNIPGSDVVVEAVDALTRHYAFPLGGEQEQQQLSVLLACLQHTGLINGLPGLNAAGVGTLLDAVEQAETISLSAATDPVWDNRHLIGALSYYKRLRAQLAGRDPLARVSPSVTDRAGHISGLDALVTDQLLQRHTMVAAAHTFLAQTPPLPGLDDRRDRANGYQERITGSLSRAVAQERAWPDFPPMQSAARADEANNRLRAEAGIEAVRYDRRAYAFAQARGEALTTQVISVSADGRTVELLLDENPTLRRNSKWWWLDDTHTEAVVGDITVGAPVPGVGMPATLHVRRQMQRIARTPQLLTAPPTIRLVTIETPFSGERWWPRSAPGPAAGPATGVSPIDYAALDQP
ncbi:MAG: hypothetical protein JWP02_1574 [Acidimicrobiales bacterium]|nr:hypothetical protein [Acidimicrobiales bacterium]